MSQQRTSREEQISDAISHLRRVHLAIIVTSVTLLVAFTRWGQRLDGAATELNTIQALIDGSPQGSLSVSEGYLHEIRSGIAWEAYPAPLGLYRAEYNSANSISAKRFGHSDSEIRSYLFYKGIALFFQNGRAIRNLSNLRGRANPSLWAMDAPQTLNDFATMWNQLSAPIDAFVLNSPIERESQRIRFRLIAEGVRRELVQSIPYQEFPEFVRIEAEREMEDIELDRSQRPQTAEERFLELRGQAEYYLSLESIDSWILTANGQPSAEQLPEVGEGGPWRLESTVFDPKAPPKSIQGVLHIYDDLWTDPDSERTISPGIPIQLTNIGRYWPQEMAMNAALKTTSSNSGLDLSSIKLGAFESSFPHVSSITKGLDSIVIHEARQLLDNLSATEGGPVSLGGVSFAMEQVGRLGLFVLLGLQAYFLLQCRWILKAWRKGYDPPILWLGFHEDPLAILAVIASLLVLPLFALGYHVTLPVSGFMPWLGRVLEAVTLVCSAYYLFRLFRDPTIETISD